MRVLLWHGYLLSGTGSNLYTANVARRWRARGHDVLVLCQERHGDRFIFVDEAGDFDGSNTSLPFKGKAAPSSEGRCRLARPTIGEILPVFVQDDYEGFTAKLFTELDDAELEAYTKANVKALTTAIDQFDPEAIVTGHEVMGPYIAKLACGETGMSYVAKLHGSGLEYAVRLQDRYRHYATEGLGGAVAVVGGSHYMVEAAADLIPGWRDKAEVVNPGYDIDIFKPVKKDFGGAPKIGYVGKLILAKGVHHLLAALCKTTAPDLEAVAVGFGGDERELRQLWATFTAGDRGAARHFAGRGDERMLGHLASWLAAGGDDARFYERATELRLEWPGRLEHDALAPVLPSWDALVVPSIVPEAFGMVAAEAAGCGVPPIVPRHSGIGEIGATLEGHLGREELLTFDPGDPIDDLARTIDGVLTLSEAERDELSTGVAEVARASWSWENTAKRLLELAV